MSWRSVLCDGGEPDEFVPLLLALGYQRDDVCFAQAGETFQPQIASKFDQFRLCFLRQIIFHHEHLRSRCGNLLINAIFVHF